jgi:hypothetical protein
MSHGLGSDNHTSGSCRRARRHRRERGDMTGSHQHLRSYAARTLHRGVDHVDATLRTLACPEPRTGDPGLSVLPGGCRRSSLRVCVPRLCVCMCMRRNKLVCVLYILKIGSKLCDSFNYKPQFSSLLYFRNSFIHSFN